MSAEIIAGVVVAAAAVAGFSAVLAAWVRRRAELGSWKRTPRGRVYRGEPIGGPEFLDRALTECMITALLTDLPERVVKSVEIRIDVQPTETWTNVEGQTVGGELYGGETLRVPPSLSSLFHEYLHACEQAEDGKVDTRHWSWGPRGFWDADNDFRRWLERNRT